MRREYDGLHGLAAHRYGEDPRSTHPLVFSNAQHNRLKILYWDGTGLWVCTKRLEKRRFSWPPPQQDLSGGKVRLTAAALAMLLGGLDLARASRKDWRRENE